MSDGTSVPRLVANLRRRTRNGVGNQVEKQTFPFWYFPGVGPRELEGERAGFLFECFAFALDSVLLSARSFSDAVEVVVSGEFCMAVILFLVYGFSVDWAVRQHGVCARLVCALTAYMISSVILRCKRGVGGGVGLCGKNGVNGRKSERAVRVGLHGGEETPPKGGY